VRWTGSGGRGQGRFRSAKLSLTLSVPLQIAQPRPLDGKGTLGVAYKNNPVHPSEFTGQSPLRPDRINGSEGPGLPAVNCPSKGGDHVAAFAPPAGCLYRSRSVRLACGPCSSCPV